MMIEASSVFLFSIYHSFKPPSRDFRGIKQLAS